MAYIVHNPVPEVWPLRVALYMRTWTKSAIQSLQCPAGTWPPISVTSAFSCATSRTGMAKTTGTFPTTRVIAARLDLLLRLPIRITWNTETFAQNQNANANSRGAHSYIFLRFRCPANAPARKHERQSSKLPSRRARRMMVYNPVPAGGRARHSTCRTPYSRRGYPLATTPTRPLPEAAHFQRQVPPEPRGLAPQLAPRPRPSSRGKK